MPNAAQPSLLRRLIGLPAPMPMREIDPADMGTAIGLDFSLDEPTDAKPTEPGSLTQASWLRRSSAS